MPNSWHVKVKDSQLMTFSQGVIRYSEMGSGSQAIVFLHGFNSQINVWDRVWKNMNNCSHAIRLDIPGFGDSIWNTSSYSLDQQAERIHQFIIEKNIDNLILVGTSMGGSLSVAFAAKYPHLVSSVILMAPSAYPGSLNYRKPFTRLIKTNWFIPISTWVVKTAIYRWLFPDSIALQTLTLQSSYSDNWVNQLKTIKVPTLLLWSKGDAIVEYQYAALVANALQNETLLTLNEEIDHNIPGRSPQLIAKLACDFANN